MNENEGNGMEFGTGGLGTDPEAVKEMVLPGGPNTGAVRTPHADGGFGPMHNAGPGPPKYDEIEDQPTEEHSQNTCLRFDLDHPERGLRLTANDRVRIDRGVRLLQRWMINVGAPLERSAIERRLLEDAVAHLRAHPTATFSSCVVNAVQLRRPQKT